MATSGPSSGLPQRNLDATQNSYSINGRLIISALVILFFIVCIILLLHCYTKRSWRSSTDIRQQPHQLHGRSNFSQETSGTCGLDTQIVVALPVFTYKSQLSMPPKPVECAVCLSEFQQDENCKSLPNCKHFFHTDCINMWFLSHTTCPLCRTTAEYLFCDEEHAEAGSTACPCTHQDGGNDHGEQHQEAPGFALCRGLGCKFAIRDDLACGTISSNEEQGNENGGALPRHQFSQQSQAAASRRWRRSVSDTFPHIGQGMKFPIHVLFWGDQTHVNSHTNFGHRRTGGRSLPHITTDILTPQENLVVVSSCPSLGSSSEPRSLVPQPVHSPPPTSRLKSCK